MPGGHRQYIVMFATFFSRHRKFLANPESILARKLSLTARLRLRLIRMYRRYPSIMNRVLMAEVTALLIAAGFGQIQAQPPAFEAASIKLSTALDNGTDRDSTPGAMTMKNFSLRSLIRVAYGVKEYQVIGGPKWMDTYRYNINAKAAGPAKDPELVLMLRTLLAERFKLEVHRQSKSASGYALVVAKSGLKIKPVEDSGNDSTSSHGGSLTAKGVSMTRLSDWLARRLNVPVVDATGIPGVFDFKLEWTPDEVSPGTPPSGGPDLSLVAALQEQLGVKLEARKVPMEMIVVDRAEKASEN